jgi:hypothetical protein
MEYLLASAFITGLAVAWMMAASNREVEVQRAIDQRAGSLQYPILFDSNGWNKLQRSINSERKHFEKTTGKLLEDVSEQIDRRAYELEGTLNYFHNRANRRLAESFKQAKLQLDQFAKELVELEPEVIEVSVKEVVEKAVAAKPKAKKTKASASVS